jgi:hypothetical protein
MPDDLGALTVAIAAGSPLPLDDRHGTLHQAQECGLPKGSPGALVSSQELSDAIAKTSHPRHRHADRGRLAAAPTPGIALSVVGAVPVLPPVNGGPKLTP